MDGKRGRVVVAVFLLFSFLAVAWAFAGADDLLKDAQKMIRNAERTMHKGDNVQADTMLKEVAELLEKAKAEDPTNKKIGRIEISYDRIRKNVDKKLGSPALTKSPSRAVQTAKAGDIGKLPGGVSKRLKDIDRKLNEAQRYITRDAKKANYKLQQAAALFDEIEKNYDGKFDQANPDFAAAQKRYAELLAGVDKQGAAEESAKAAEAGAKTGQEQESEEWRLQFLGYLSYPGQEGHDPEKLVFVPGTSEPEKFVEAERRYKAFKAFYEKYQKADFPNGKTRALENLADDQAQRRLKDFEEGFASRVESVSGDAEKQIDDAMHYLTRNNEWQTDDKKMPNLVDSNRMSGIAEATNRVVKALPESDARRQQLQAKYAALVAKDSEYRQIRKERTFMTPDLYTGGDISDLKKKAESLVKDNTREGGEPLRSTIISKNWQEQTVKEWTDSTQSAWRIRTTRSLTAQVAAKTADGVRLITVALAKDKLSDGSWGALYGNLHQYSDPMLGANVNK